jgi:hypothetical protein
VPNLEIISIPASVEPSPAPQIALNQLKDELWAIARSQEQFPFDSISVGGVTGMCKIALSYAMTLMVQDGGGQRLIARGPGETESQPHYKPAMTWIEKWVFGMMPLPCHFIVGCHMQLRDEAIKGTKGREMVGEPKWMPSIIGIGLRAEFPAWFNETFRCYKEFDSQLGRSRYYWDTEGGYTYDFFKSSFNNGFRRLWKSPLEIDLESDEPQGFEWILSELKQKGGEEEKA